MATDVDLLHHEEGVRPLFDSSEHLLIGDGARLRFFDSFGDYAARLPLPIAPNYTLTYGQIVYLAGDFFNSADPISDGANLLDRQERAFYGFDMLCSPSMQSQINQINEIVTTREGPTFAQGVYLGAVPSIYFALNFHDLENVEFTKITNGRYLALLFTNWDHFGHHAIAAYIAAHSLAIKRAVKAHGLPNDQALPLLQKAYAMNAFADHFLTDLFSAGHLRTPRKHLHNLWISKAGDKLSQYMHDEDCRVGLNVVNRQGTRWRAYGDNRYLDNVTIENKIMVGVAIQASIDEIYTAFLSGIVPAEEEASYQALAHVPTLRPDNVANDPGRNYPGLFNSDASLRRDAINDLTSTKTTSYTGPTLLAYLTTSYSSPKLPSVPHPPDTAPRITSFIDTGYHSVPPDMVSGNKVSYCASFVRVAANETDFDYESDFGPWSDWATYDNAFNAVLDSVPRSLERTAIYRRFQYPDGSRSRSQCIAVINAYNITTWTDTNFAGHRWELGVVSDSWTPADVAIGQDGNVFVSSQTGGVYIYRGQRRAVPVQVDTPFYSISPVDRNTIWGKSDNWALFKWTPDGAVQVGSKKAQSIAAVDGERCFFVEARSGQLFDTLGNGYTPYGGLPQISEIAYSRSDGVLYATDAYDGSLYSIVPTPGSPVWTKIAGAPNSGLVAVGMLGDLWTGSLDNSSVLNVMRRHDAATYNYQGMSRVAKIAVGNSADVWVVSAENPEQRVYRFTGLDYRYKR
jgi:hypothetical protein